MQVEKNTITVRELVDKYEDNEDEGVFGFGGKLNIRPKYQREFIYKDKERNAVIDTVKSGLPLGTIYWTNTKDGNYELLDGQQRILSICQYVAGNFSVEFTPKMPQAFHNLTDEEQQQILDYTLDIYVCIGSESEKLKWFERINIPGAQLTQQELRNAIYSGEWLTDAKKYFSRRGGPGYSVGKDYLKGDCIRQDYLQTAIAWISDGNIEQYMSDNQHKQNASALWRHFNQVIDWVKVTLPEYRKEMKGINWGSLYREFSNNEYNTKELADRVEQLMLDEDVSKKQGIYPYIFTGEEKFLNIRAFTPRQKRQAFEQQNGICAHCKEKFTIDEMEADHIKPWSQGGQTILDNCQMLCKHCNRTKSNQ